ncbi:MAG TPA: NAD(P)-dependent alcohol dehydrogenase [Acidobacteriota bacterium]|nr:NAD(P)-dependent alcohol dehydrogenase [Acidobacteriota bacterium]
MKAIVYTKYGGPEVLDLKEVERPVPRDGEVLVRVQASALNAYDWHLLKADIFLVRLMGGGLFKPKTRTPGADIAGRIEAVGPNAGRFRPGEGVFGEIAGSGGGGLAEFARTRESLLAPMPAGLSFEEAAAAPMAALTALQGLRDKGKIRPGMKVLINGASGGVGTFAIQIAKLFGAEVTAVCSPDKMDIARSLRADHIIDYTREDFTRRGERYDVIFAANGYHPLWAYKRALAPKGVYAMAGGAAAQIFQAMLLGPGMSIGARKMGAVMARVSAEDLLAIKELLETRKIVPVIDRRYPLEQAREAFSYFGEGHARGKVIITVGHHE